MHPCTPYNVRDSSFCFTFAPVKKLLTSLLLFTFLAQTFSQGWYYMGYVIEKKAYMQRCINKYRPQLHCDGKCQLMKKIKEQEEKEQQQAPELKIAKTQVFSSSSSFPCFIPKPVSTKRSFYEIIKSGAPVDRPAALFHPPGNSSRV